MPVFISFVAEPGGITTVQRSDVSPGPPSFPNFSAFASVHGVVAAVNGDGTVQVQANGLLTLTAPQWDAVTGDVGGLTQGNSYFATRSGVPNALTSVPDPTPGSFTTRVGVAINSTTMLIEPDAPVQNLGDLIVFAQFAGQPLPVGSAVFVFSDNSVTGADSDGSSAEAQAIGVIAALDVNGAPIVQIAGTVTLTSAQWDVVTDTVPGMSAGTAYFVAITPGGLTSVPPVTGSRVQVGVGFNTTQLVLSAPFLLPLP